MTRVRAGLRAALTWAAFGLKNKNKSSKVQKFVEQVNKQQSEAGKNKADVSRSPPEGARTGMGQSSRPGRKAKAGRGAQEGKGGRRGQEEDGRPALQHCPGPEGALWNR